MTRLFFMIALVSAASALSAATLPATNPSDFDRAVLPFIQQNCFRCHGEKKQKGELRLDTLPRDFIGGGAGRWGDVIDRISSGEMPPKKEARPDTAEAARVVDWLAARIKEGETTRLAQRDRVNFYKLTREEYANTIYDLLGVHYDATDPTSLPEDPSWRGFERIGSVLSLSPAHVEKYFAAAEGVLAEAMPPKPPVQMSLHWSALDMRGVSNRKELEANGLAEKVRLDVWPGSTFNGQPGSVRTLEIKQTGDYRFRIKLSGLRPENGRAPHVTFYAADLDRMLFEQDVVAPEDKPITLEFTTHLPAGPHPLRMTNEAPGPSNLPRAGRNGNKPFFSIKDGREPWQWKLTDEQGRPIMPFLIVDWVEVEGPITSGWPTAAQKEFDADGKPEPSQMRDLLTRFAEKAFRRPVASEQIDRYVALVQSEMQNGETCDSAVKTGMLAILCSKDFFYLVEGTPERNEPKVNDFELASRLSYFLWSTMPDEPLMNAARDGSLHRPEVLKAQLDRMMHDPRIERFAEEFPREWLQLQRVGMFPPDKKLYPMYDAYLQKSMIGETTSFFRQVLDQNLTLREFLESDWTMLNARLAEHYGIPNVSEDQFVRVPLRPEEHRGGLLTMASILTLTSDGTRHRPVHRGKWVLESILNNPPPPPPANVKPIETTPPTQKKATIRQKLMAHQSNPSCAACHSKIDPLGLAFDNYDAIGQWRTEEIVRDGSGDNPKVDASGQLIDGRTFADADGLKKLMLDDVDKFNGAFVEKLATFALRRGMTIDDRPDLAAIARQSKAADYKLDSIVEALVMSDLFQKR